jgi:hypothetical protein
MNIKRIVWEGTQNRYVDKVFDTIRGGLGLDPKKKVRFGFGGFDDYIDSRSGINVILNKNQGISERMKEYFVERYGMSEEESELMVTKIRHYLKKENFVEKVAWVLYEDYIQYQKNPYYYVDYDDPYEDKVYNLKKLDDFIEFVRNVYSLKDFYDVHSDERIDFDPMLDRDDYEYIQSEVMRMIKGDDITYLSEGNRTILKVLKEESMGRLPKLKKQRYSPIRDWATWDEENRELIWKPSVDPEVMDWIAKDLRRRVRPLLKPIGPGFKFQTVGVELPFIEKPISTKLFTDIDVQDVTTKEGLASLHGEEMVDGFIEMMDYDYELIDELSIIDQYKRLSRFIKIMGEHHKMEHRW